MADKFITMNYICRKLEPKYYESGITARHGKSALQNLDKLRVFFKAVETDGPCFCSTMSGITLHSVLCSRAFLVGRGDGQEREQVCVEHCRGSRVVTVI